MFHIKTKAAWLLLFLTLFSGVFVSCKKEKKDNTPLLILLALMLSKKEDCENKSGFVICIPPGLRQ